MAPCSGVPTLHRAASREHEIVDESVSDCGKCITLTLTHDYFDSFPDRAPLVEARAASEYWQRRIGQHAATLATVVLARAYDRGRRTLTYAVERVARLSRAELVALSPLHRGWVEEEGNAAEDYYVLFLS